MSNSDDNSDFIRKFLPRFLDGPPKNLGEESIRLKQLHDFLTHECSSFYKKYHLKPLFCESSDGNTNYNIETVCETFSQDINRMVKDSLPIASDTPDHFKLAGILAYWLRRYPVAYGFEEIEYSSSAKPVELPPENIINIMTRMTHESEATSDELKKMKGKYCPWFLMYRYHQAYFAFNIGLEVCYRFERESNWEDRPELPTKFSHMVCHFLKYKNVSPHGLIMIYQGIYQNPNIEFGIQYPNLY